MKRLCSLVLGLVAVGLVSAHGGSDDDDHHVSYDDATYAQIHMAQEHHIDAFDLEAFFALHDLNRDGVLDESELEAIYGLHHETSRTESGSHDEHQDKSKDIMTAVLKSLDKNKDGVVTVREFVAAGAGGLPNFKDVKGLGHHYDSEDEYFIHHEELYHSTPETQGEDSYVHPEDIAHFAQHDKIEQEEEERARKAQGLPPTDASNDQVVLDAQNSAVSREEQERRNRAAEAAAQAAKYSAMKEEADKRGEWNKNKDGFRRPKDPADRLRANIPYKFKMKKSFFGEF